MRETLMPPPVLPAHAPTNIKSTSTVFEVCDQRSKSAVENPVVVIMEATWKAEWRSASAICIASCKRLIKIMAVEAKIIRK